jgi:16S rRNA processing protein RimM
MGRAMSSTSSNPESQAPAGGSRPAPTTVLVGRILRPHGLRGEVVVEVTSEVPGRFADGSELLLRAKDGSQRAVRIAQGKLYGKTALVRLDGASSRDDAEALRDCELEVPVELVPAAPPGVFWQHELVGATCRDRREGELGVVEGLMEQGGGLLLRVVGARGELLIPFAEPFLGGLDRATRTLTVDLPPGLIEACASRS